MSDTSKPTVTTTFPAIAGTVIASGTIGEQISEQLGDTFAWLVTLSCQCSPPTAVIGLFHSVATGIVLGAALLIHYQIAKIKQS